MDTQLLFCLLVIFVYALLSAFVYLATPAKDRFKVVESIPISYLAKQVLSAALTMGQDALKLTQDLLFGFGSGFRDAGAAVGQDFKSAFVAIWKAFALQKIIQIVIVFILMSQIPEVLPTLQKLIQAHLLKAQ